MKTAKTNVKHHEQARAEVTFNGKKAIMTLDWEKPNRFYIHVRGMGTNKVIAEEYDPRAILLEWTRAMKKHGGELVARTPKQRDLQQKQHQLAANFKNSNSAYFAPEFLRAIRKAYLQDVRYGQTKADARKAAATASRAFGKIYMKFLDQVENVIEDFKSDLDEADADKGIDEDYVKLMKSLEDGFENLVDKYAKAAFKKRKSSSERQSIGGRGRRAPRDPVWIKAKYPGVDIDGKPFKKGDKVLYWPNGRKFMQGPKAEQAWRDFQAQIADEIMYNADARQAGDKEAYRAYFEKKLKEWGIKSPTELDDAKKRKFFEEVDKGWKSDKEEGVSEGARTPVIRTKDDGLHKTNKKVVDSFLFKEKGASKFLKSDGKKLDGVWKGGEKLAWWKGNEVWLHPGLRDRGGIYGAVRSYILSHGAGITVKE